MKIKDKFLQLTKKTYPHGTESQLEKNLPKGYLIDKWGNYYLRIGENPSTMFTCHLDTASYKEQKVNHVFDDNFIRTDGASILGADDKAGMVVLLYMISKKIPGLYYFFLGEERGCVGSSALADGWNKMPFSNIKRCVSFDRRGTTSVITEQIYGTCCSNEFAQELSNRLNLTNDFRFSPDPTGIYTDSAQFTNLIPECTNISVGYYNEHTNKECIDILFLEKLCESIIKIDWETLPVVRDPKKYGEKYYNI